MNGRKVVIDQALCRKVELLVKGGAKHTEVAQICGISAATVSRIRTSGYDAEQFKQNNDKRREEEQKKRITALDKAIEEVRSDENATKDSLLMSSALVIGPQHMKDQLSGQMEMDLVKKEEPAKTAPDEMTKLMRFWAAQMQKLVDAIDKLSQAALAGDH